jgi:hypothetical protein
MPKRIGGPNRKRTKRSMRRPQMARRNGNVAPRTKRPDPTRIRRYYYQSFNSTAVTTSGSLTSLCPVANGTGYNGRLGTKIRVEFIRVRLLVQASLQSTIATADLTNNVRVIVSLAKGPASGITTSDFPTITSQFDYKEPVDVLFDRTIFLNNLASGLAAAGSAYGATPSAVWIQDLEGGAGAGYFDIPVNRDISFDSTSGTSDDDHMPLLYLVSDSSVTPNPTVLGEIRAYYSEVLE